MRLSAGFCSGLIGSCPTSCSARGVAVCVLCLTTFGAPHCQQCAYRSSIPVPQLLQRHITGADIIPFARTVKTKTDFSCQPKICAVGCFDHPSKRKMKRADLC